MVLGFVLISLTSCQYNIYLYKQYSSGLLDIYALKNQKYDTEYFKLYNITKVHEFAI